MMSEGRIPLENPLVLAPLAGITDLAFRLMAKRFGCALVVSEMVSAAGLHYGGRGSRDLLQTRAEEAPLAVQIFGSDPAMMAEAAAIAREHGAAVIDVNMGCPVRKVVKTGAGIALMRKPELAARIVRAIREAVDLPVTAKFRAGPDRGHPSAVEFARRLADAGADALTVHGRFGGTRFSIPADWTVIREVARAVAVPVIGNGDVAGGADAKRMLDETGAAAVMVGRGALGRPWIFREIRAFLEGRPSAPPDGDEKQRIILEHLELMCECKTETVAVREFRKHLIWYTKGLNGGARLRGQLSGIHDKQTLIARIQSVFGPG